MGRVGLDIGDDNGVLFGVGVGYDISKWAQIRTEYIAKNLVNSFQVNWVSEF